jgi:tRNA (guanine-N7-)-methyltransferase
MLNYLLLPGGFFQLATDVDWYAEETSDTFSKCGAFDVDPIIKNPDRPYVTKYERKWKAMGKNTWLLTLHKNGKVLPNSDGVDNWEMEIEAESNKTLMAVLKEFDGAEGKVNEGKGHWVFRDSFISESKIGLLSVITADEGFEQHFYFKVIPSRKGFTIKIDSTGHPYRTPAMRAALHYALDLVSAQ